MKRIPIAIIVAVYRAITIALLQIVNWKVASMVAEEGKHLKMYYFEDWYVAAIFYIYIS